MVAMEPQYLAIFAYVCYEAFVIILLVLPMPNNRMRGLLTKAITIPWKKSVWFRNTHWVMLAINAYFFWASMNQLHSHPADHNVEVVTCEGMLLKMSLQRNAYVSGFGIFLFFVMRRLLEIQMQLHKSRVIMKQLQKGTMGTSGLRPSISQDDSWTNYVDEDVSKVLDDTHKVLGEAKKQK